MNSDLRLAIQFQKRFATEEQCRESLLKMRWLKGISMSKL